jgi:GNAT superfamily N-acetyltransferase
MNAMPEIAFVPDTEGPEAQAVREGLNAHRREALGEVSQPSPLCFYHRDAEGTVRAGLVGEIAHSWLFVDKFWVDDELRGQGIGARLLAAAEAFAQEQGAVGAQLFTNSYQAPDFYEKHGFVALGRLEDRPPGFQRYWYCKRW